MPSLRARSLVVPASLTIACLAGGNAGAVILNLTDPNPTYYDAGAPGCPRGDANDDCVTSGYLSWGAANAKDNSAPVFAQAFNAWNTAQPAGSKWTLRNGGRLNGTINITTFTTFNQCPDTDGVEVRAYFTPGRGDPTSWIWVQGLYDNYRPGPLPGHDAGGLPLRSEMDISTAAGVATPPAYPHQYPDGHFYDRPAAACIHMSSIYFDAVALIANANYTTRTLTTYEGFAYGFATSCVHVTPSPGSLALVAAGGLIAARRRRVA